MLKQKLSKSTDMTYSMEQQRVGPKAAKEQNIFYRERLTKGREKVVERSGADMTRVSDVIVSELLH